VIGFFWRGDVGRTAIPSRSEEVPVYLWLLIFELVLLAAVAAAVVASGAATTAAFERLRGSRGGD
jgi:hypothetical protein